MPQPGDSEGQILQKRQSRRRALEALKAGMSADAILAQERALERSGDTPQPPAAPTLDLPEIPDFTAMSDAELDAYIAQQEGR
ncbi:MAG: hypothetical protein CMK92_02920 [Pseudomonas sp.]|nr:hypothetical protein [Pseudomonas sp.]